MTKFADLHIHTDYSDSTLSPDEIVDQAVRCGLACISITDHDTIEGIEPTQKAAEAFGLEVIAGIELSSQEQGKDVHILGYFLDGISDDFAGRLTAIQDARVRRIREMVCKLEALGIKGIDAEDVMDLTKSNSVGRPHLAAVLQKKGFVSSSAEAFKKYIGEKCPAYVEKYKQSAIQAIRLVRESRGIAVLAHPGVTGRDELIPSFVEAGLDGIEVYHPKHSASAVAYYQRIARKHGLLVTGGSDAHGKVKSDTHIGKQKIPYELVEKLKNIKGRKRDDDR